MRLQSHEAGLELIVRSSAPSALRLVAHDLRGKPWASAWSREATDHRFPIPGEPLLPPLELEVETGSDLQRRALDLPRDHDRILWERVVTWFETEITKPIADELAALDQNTLALNRWMGGASRAEAIQVRLVTEAIRKYGSLHSLGGSSGLLASPSVPLELKDRFYTALGPLEVCAGVLFSLFPAGAERSVPELTAPGFGPLRRAPPAEVQRHVLSLTFVNQNEIFEILPDSDAIEALPDLDRRPNWAHGILAEVDLPDLDPTSVATLSGEGWMPRGTHLLVRVNDRYHLRMAIASPGAGGASLLGVRFPAEMLERGKNRFYIHMPPLPSFADMQLKTDGTRLVPPGISLCFEKS